MYTYCRLLTATVTQDTDVQVNLSKTNKLDPCRDNQIGIETSLWRCSEADGIGDTVGSINANTRVAGAGTEGPGRAVGVV